MVYLIKALVNASGSHFLLLSSLACWRLAPTRALATSTTPSTTSAHTTTAALKTLGRHHVAVAGTHIHAWHSHKVSHHGHHAHSPSHPGIHHGSGILLQQLCPVLGHFLPMCVTYFKRIAMDGKHLSHFWRVFPLLVGFATTADLHFNYIAISWSWQVLIPCKFMTENL